MLQEIYQILSNGILQNLKYYALAVVGFAVLEHFCPAEIGQSLKAKWISIQVSVSTLIIGPVALFLVARLIQEPIVRVWGKPLLLIDLVNAKEHGRVGVIFFNCIAPFLSVLLVDLFYYWMHRAQHTFPILWDFHKVHHSDHALNASTAARQHFTDRILYVFFIAIPISLLVDLRTGNGAWLTFPLSFWGYFIHANIRLPMGPLTRFLGGPQVHRVHHSIEPRHFDKNFAAYFPIIDVILGTYYHPAKNEWPKTGVDTGEDVRNAWHALYMPLERLMGRRTVSYMDVGAGKPSERFL